MKPLTKDSIGVIIDIDTSYRLDFANVVTINVVKPSGLDEVWANVEILHANNGIIRYVTVAGDLDEDGVYSLQVDASFTDELRLLSTPRQIRVVKNG